MSLWLDRNYYRSLDWALDRQRFMLVLTGATLALTVGSMGLSFPKASCRVRTRACSASFWKPRQTPPSSAMVALQAEVAEDFPQGPGSDAASTSVLGVGPLNATTNVGRLTVTLRSRDVRSVSADEIADRLKAAGEQTLGATLYRRAGAGHSDHDARRAARNINIRSPPPTRGDLLRWSNRLLDQIARDAGLTNVAAETQDGGLRTLMRIDRDKMGRLGISAQNVDDVLNDAFGQRQISTIYTQSNQYRVILEAAPQYLRDPSALEKLYVAPTGGGPQTPLATFVRVREYLRAAFRRASGSVSGVDDQLRSCRRAWRSATR